MTGSPLYMAPEQIMRTHPARPPHRYLRDGGDRLFPAHRPAAVPRLRRDGRDGRPRPRPRRPALAASRRRPGDLEKVVLRCLEKNPDDRYQDAAEPGRALCRVRRRRRLVARAGGRLVAGTRAVDRQPRRSIAPSAQIPGPAISSDCTGRRGRCAEPWGQRARERSASPVRRSRSDSALSIGEDETDRSGRDR